MDRRILVGVVTALALLVGPGPAAAHADGSTGAVTGTVTDQAGTPLAGICVEAYPKTLGTTSLPTAGQSSQPTDATGTYVISGLQPGSYAVHFGDCTGNQHFPMWYDQQPSFQYASVLDVQAGSTLSGIDAQLGPAGEVSGTVTDASGNTQAGVCVSGLRQTGTGPESLDTDIVLTDPSGQYSLPVRAGDAYDVEFSICTYATNGGNFLTQHYDGQTDPANATLVTAQSGQSVTGIDAALQPGGEISGTLTDSSGNPVSGICAAAMATGVNITSAPSDSTGNFVIHRLPTGSYEVQFSDCAGSGNWATQWYDDQLNQSSANPVSVTAGQATTGVDDTLVHAGSISGTVTDTQGNPLPGVCVSLRDSSEIVWTDSNGHYTLSELSAGSYLVAFAESCAPSDYIPQWYDGAANTADATPVTVTLGRDTSGIDAHLVFGGKISGSITPAGGPADPICIQASDGAGHTYSSSVWGGNGTYTIGPIPPGSYSVEFRDCSSTPTFQTQWYNREAAPGVANPVTVSGGQTTSGINAAMGAPLIPFVSGISPNQGPTSGGTDVTISGAGLTGATAVLFGNQPTTSYQVLSDGQITATAPAGQLGTVDIRVTGPGGTSAPEPSDRFTYKLQPTVTSVTPGSGVAGMLVAVAGSHLSQAQISFGGAQATVVTVLSDSSLIVRVPSHSPGSVDVTAVLSGITSPPAPGDRFTYLA